MDKINEQLIRIETKLETLLMMAKARNVSKEKQLNDELKKLEKHRSEDEMTVELKITKNNIR